MLAAGWCSAAILPIIAVSQQRKIKNIRANEDKLKKTLLIIWPQETSEDNEILSKLVADIDK